MEDIYLEPETMLVERLDDYYKKDNPFRVTEDGKASEYEVGIIRHASSDIPNELIGSIIFYQKNICTRIDLKKIGMFHLVPKHYRLLIRTDQNENNY